MDGATRAPAVSQLHPRLEEIREEHRSVIHEGLGGESLNLASVWGRMHMMCLGKAAGGDTTLILP